jgi:hypothetical protein
LECVTQCVTIFRGRLVCRSLECAATVRHTCMTLRLLRREPTSSADLWQGGRWAVTSYRQKAQDGLYPIKTVTAWSWRPVNMAAPAHGVENLGRPARFCGSYGSCAHVPRGATEGLPQSSQPSLSSTLFPASTSLREGRGHPERKRANPPQVRTSNS